MLEVGWYVSVGVVLVVLSVDQATPSAGVVTGCSAHLPKRLAFLEHTPGIIHFNITGQCVIYDTVVKLSRAFEFSSKYSLICAIILPVDRVDSGVVGSGHQNGGGGVGSGPDSVGDDGCICRAGENDSHVECEISMQMNQSLNNTRWTVWTSDYPEMRMPNMTVYVVAKAPVIHQESPRGHNPLIQGDVITCVVTGGNAPDNKNNVHFHCSNPDLHSNQLQVADTLVSRRVTVTESGDVTEEDMVCVCTANWTSNTTKLYALSSTANYSLEHRAVVKLFTLRHVSRGKTATETSLTVNSTQRGTTVRLVCDSFGRPRPIYVRFTRPNGAAIHADQTIISNWTSRTSTTLPEVGCPDTGHYICTASNGVAKGDTKTIFLDVRCPPERQGHATLNMTQHQGVTFTLVASPVPETFVFNHHGNNTSNPGQFAPPGKFSSRCTQDQQLQFKVTCEISLLDASGNFDGYYSVNVGNALGDVNVWFRYLPADGTSTPASTSGNSSNRSEGAFSVMLPVVVIISGVLFMVIVITVVIVVVVCRDRKKKRDLSNRRAGLHNVELQEVGGGNDDNDQNLYTEIQDILPPASSLPGGYRNRKDMPLPAIPGPSTNQ